MKKNDLFLTVTKKALAEDKGKYEDSPRRQAVVLTGEKNGAAHEAAKCSLCDI